jgi:hypothetical protein
VNPADRIIDSLVADVRPVRRLRPPLLRALGWSGLALVVGLFVALLHGVRPDLAARLTDPLYLVSTGAALATGMLAAIAALMASMPDRSPRWLLLPLPTALLWVGGITGGCLMHWVAFDRSWVSLAQVLDCLGILVTVSLPLSAVLFWMLRPLARVAPAGTILMAGFATAALAAATLNIVHRFDASVIILAWNFGAALLVLGFDLIVARMVGASRRRPAPGIQPAR